MLFFHPYSHFLSTPEKPKDQASVIWLIVAKGLRSSQPSRWGCCTFGCCIDADVEYPRLEAWWTRDIVRGARGLTQPERPRNDPHHARGANATTNRLESIQGGSEWITTHCIIHYYMRSVCHFFFFFFIFFFYPTTLFRFSADPNSKRA